MPQDSMELLVAGLKIDSFLSYSIESDLYVADDAFQIEMGGHVTGFAEGDMCQMLVNGTLVLTGIVDRLTRAYSKEGRTTTIEGRDLMGIVVDSYCEKFVTYKGKTIKELAEILLPDVQYINRKDIVYDTGAGKRDSTVRIVQIEPGATVFDILSDAARSRGLLFYSRDNGTFVFGRPTGRGLSWFSLVCKDGDNRSRILKGQIVNDTSRRYSKITVVGQQQGFDDLESTAVNVSASVTDPDAKVEKTYVETVNNDDKTPAKRAKQLLERQRYASRQVSYTVAGHTQNGQVWETDRLCDVDDDELDIHETMLVYYRKLTMSKADGCRTELKLGPPGVGDA